jgi:hypothetical protein
MNTRLSKTPAFALLALVLALNVAPSAYAASRDGDEPFGVRDRIVRFIHDVQNFFHPHTSSDQLTPPRS